MRDGGKKRECVCEREEYGERDKKRGKYEEGERIQREREGLREKKKRGRERESEGKIKPLRGPLFTPPLVNFTIIL
jgi:hypothetical protein